jgi:hypothetical protein
MTSTWLIVVLALALIMLSHQPAVAQPARWDLKVLFLPLGPPQTDARGTGASWLASYRDTYFPGEMANLTFQLVNVDCSQRIYTPFVKEFRRAWESDVSPIFERARILKEAGFIENYSVQDTNIEIYGDRKIADWRLEIYGYCSGRAIYVESATVWFAWKGIGRAVEAAARIERSLEALKPLDYILKNDINSSITIFTTSLRVPPSVDPSQLDTQPTVTIRMRYPSGFSYEYDYSPLGWPEGLEIWGLRGAAYGRFRLSPYRTFSLYIKDYEGVIALPGAEVVINAYVYPFKMSLSADGEGAVEVRRLPDAYTYEVVVNYTVPLLGQELTVLIGFYDAYRLALAGELRTELYTLRISPVDRSGRAIEGALVRIRPDEFGLGGSEFAAENATRGGYAAFYLVPTGNYTFIVEWRGVTVFRGYRYVGTHPTYGFAPPSFSIPTSVDDLVLMALDKAGNSVGAFFTVKGPSAETSFYQIEAADGVLRLPQMPIADYTVSAANYSKIFNVRVEVTATVRPGSEVRLSLPIYGVVLRALSMDGKPLSGALVRLHSISATTDTSGRALFAGVPSGSYGVEVVFENITVHRGLVEVRDNVFEDLECYVYDAHVRFLSADGAPVIVHWSLSSPGRRFEGMGAEIMLELLPEQEYGLAARLVQDGRESLILDENVLAFQLRDAVFTLPLGKLALRVLWDDGTPFEGYVSALGDGRRLVGGVVELGTLPFGTYNVSVIGGGGVEVLRLEIRHDGGEKTIRVGSATIVVRVTDVLGRPLEGARITLQSPKAPGVTLATATTPSDGTVKITRIPAALAPLKVVATYGGLSDEHWVTQGEVTISFPALAIGGTLLDAGLVLVGVGGLVALIVSMELLRGFLRKRKTAAE